MIDDPNSVMDVMLGIIALTSGKRTMEGYVADMRKKEQTKERIAKVTRTLTPYNDALIKGTVKVVRKASKVPVVAAEPIVHKPSPLKTESLAISHPPK